MKFLMRFSHLDSSEPLARHCGAMQNTTVASSYKAKSSESPPKKERKKEEKKCQRRKCCAMIMGGTKRRRIATLASLALKISHQVPHIAC